MPLTRAFQLQYSVFLVGVVQLKAAATRPDCIIHFLPGARARHPLWSNTQTMSTSEGAEGEETSTPDGKAGQDGTGDQFTHDVLEVFVCHYHMLHVHTLDLRQVANESFKRPQSISQRGHDGCKGPAKCKGHATVSLVRPG